MCSLACSAAGFLVTDLFYALILWGQGQNAWAAVGYLTLRETCVGLLFSPLVFLLYSAVYRKCHVDD